MTTFANLKNIKAFTLNELLVALGILSIVILLGAVMLEQILISQKKATVDSDASLFIDSLSSWLKSGKLYNIPTLPSGLNPALSCTGVFNGLNLPVEVSSDVWNGINVSIPVASTGSDWRYRSFGSSPADGSATLSSGTLITKSLQIAPGDGLQARLRSLANVSQADYTTNKVTASVVPRLFLQLRLRLIKKISNTLVGSPEDKPMRDVFFEFPVGVLSGSVQSCLPEKTMADSCRLQGGVLDSVTGTCKPTAACEFSGRYIEYSCTTSNPSYSIAMGTYPCNQFALLGDISQANNELTSAQSCPPGSTVFFMGEAGPLINSFTVSCGKKCSFTVNHSYQEKYYSCMRCN